MEYLEGELFACHRKQRSATAACNNNLIKKNGLKIDYQLYTYLIYILYIYIYTIYIYFIDFFSFIRSVAIAHSHIYPTCSHLFCLYCNKIGDRPKITITKNKVRKSRVEQG